MAYDEDLAARVRELLTGADAVAELPMFGGLAFLIAGNMAVAVSSWGGLLVRVGPGAYAEAIAHPAASEFVMGERVMRGWVRVDADAVATRRGLEPWVTRGVSFAQTLPAKPAR